MKNTKLLIALLFISFLGINLAKAQRGGINWTKDGNSYYQSAGGEIVTITLPKNERKVIVGRQLLTPANAQNPLNVRSFQFSNDGTKALIYTNTKRVWRQDSRG
ncbi:MAG: S9 family peptidase, partial [Moraxellaceae bacterium]